MAKDANANRHAHAGVSSLAKAGLQEAVFLAPSVLQLRRRL